MSGIFGKTEEGLAMIIRVYLSRLIIGLFFKGFGCVECAKRLSHVNVFALVEIDGIISFNRLIDIRVLGTILL